MNWSSFLEWAFQALSAGCIGYAAYCMGQLKASVEELNRQMAVILERDVWHTKWLEKHDQEIDLLKRETR